LVIDAANDTMTLGSLIAARRIGGERLLPSVVILKRRVHQCREAAFFRIVFECPCLGSAASG
jgi:hypothetical protein